MTPGVCSQFCASGGWRFSGVEAGNECWCGNTLDTSLVADPATCNTPCTGDANTICGGGWRLNVYDRGTNIPPIQDVPGWTYQNCYTDDWARTLAITQPTSTTLTPAACATLCQGHRYFGVEAGNECYCGDDLDAAKLASDPTTCSTACTGQPNFVCGGGWRLTIYHRTPPPAEQVPGWANVSCTIDGSTRTLTGPSFTQNDMTASRCAALCCGWKYFGLQNGNECFCGNSVATGLDAPAMDCDIACAGNSSFACGAGWRLNLYEDLPGDAPGCASNCSVARSCDAANCQGSFDMDTGNATCKGAFLGCQCEPTAQTCGLKQSCDLNNCGGTFDANGVATCKNFFKGCSCNPTPQTCGPLQSCDANNCNGQFSLADGKAYCTNYWQGCECQSTPQTCGPPQSCDMNSCAGVFNLADGKAYCSNFFVGCECAATPGTCGNPQSCDSNNCAGQFSMSDGKAYCSNFFKGCECQSTTQTCGAHASCDDNNCWGSFNLGDGLAYCQGWFAGCQCNPTQYTCGDPQRCDLNSCNGQFDLNQGVAYCAGKFYGCRCDPTDTATCGQMQSCDANDCWGSYDVSGVARCRGKWAGCRCYATANTCGNMASCDQNGCNGAWDGSGRARCTGNFPGCPCYATSAMCGTPLSCSLNGCNGRGDGGGGGYCQDAFAGCACVPTAATPGYCSQLVMCSWSGCNGRNVGTNLGRCTTSSHYNCPCTNPPALPPTDPPAQQGDCAARVLNMVGQINRFNRAVVCTNDQDFPIFTGSNGFYSNGAVDVWLVASSYQWTLSVAKSGRSHGFPDPVCLYTDDLKRWINTNALGCLAGQQSFFRACYPINVGYQQAQICLGFSEYWTTCGSSTMNGAVMISG